MMLETLPMRAGTVPMQKDGSADGVDVKHYKAGEIYAKQVELRKGMILEGHTHCYDHLSLLAAGRVAVTVDGKTKVYTGPAGVAIEAEKVHSIMALEDSLWYCLHAVPEEMPMHQIDEWLVTDPA